MANIKKGLLIIMSGPSGVGKGTVRREVMKDENVNLVYSISMTTRYQRAGEQNGVDYYFVSKEDFKKAIENDELLEWAEFVGNFYGTPKQKVEELRNQGKDVILEIEVNGTEQVLNKFKGDEGVISIFLYPPSFEALESRIRGRSTETEELIQERLAKASREMKLKTRYDYVVINDNLEKASNEIKEIIKNKKSMII